MWLYENATAIELSKRLPALKIENVDENFCSFVFRHCLFLVDKEGKNINIKGRPLGYLSDSHTFTSIDEVVKFLLHFNK